MNSRRLLLALSIGIVFVGLEVEAWVLIVASLFLIWKYCIEFLKLQKPSRWFTNTLTLLFFAIVLVKYRTVLNQDASSSFLILLTSLKLLEERSLRDQKFLFLLGFVLLSALFLFSLEVPALIAGLTSFFFLWSAQGSQIKYSRVFLKALPFAVFLFLFFPRVQNPFGFQGLTNTQGSTGFSDELSPGSISKIQNSSELAFRVQFLKENKRYRSQDQYWRGQVLTLSEGLRWTKAPTPTLERVFEKIPTPDYEVTLEPKGKRWLFVWEPTDLIQAAKFPFLLKRGNYFETVAPVYERSIYQGQFANEAPKSEPTAIELQTPALSDKLIALVGTLTNGVTSRDQIVENYLNYFRSEKFQYTKSPGTTPSLDQFLFTGKKGYCEHYAASLATLLRASKVPARVVTGYQGGEFNSYGRFWKFTQADAHAWVEYLNDQSQWERVDPTSVVAPERIELGGVLFEGLPEEWIGQGRAGDYLKSRESWWYQARETVLQNLESWNYDLVLFLIDFNLERQKEIFQEYRGWVIAGGVLLLLPFLLQSVFRRRKPSYAEWLLKELATSARLVGLTREPSETLRAFVLRWGEKVPEHQKPLAEILRAFETEEYTKSDSPRVAVSELKVQLKRLRKPVRTAAVFKN